MAELKTNCPGRQFENEGRSARNFPLRAALFALLAGAAISACRSEPPPAPAGSPNHFVSLTRFSGWQSSRETNFAVLTSPSIPSRMEWNQLIVSWNLDLGRDDLAEIEAAPVFHGRPGKFYNMGRWTPPESSASRESVLRQRDEAGQVKTDTLLLSQPATGVVIRLRLKDRIQPAQLRFVGLSFTDTHTAIPPQRAPNQTAWGKTVEVPEKSQLGYPDADGWCSPASVSMVLSYWSQRLNRPELDRAVPEVARGIYDRNWPGTGNWPFNTAYAASFKGVRACVTRFDDLREVEDWIGAGFPVILSAPYHLLNNSPPTASTGHVVVCVGFTGSGEVVINDPWARLETGQRVRRIYPRANVVRAWKASQNTVYLIYPEKARIPPNRYGHWEGSRKGDR